MTKNILLTNDDGIYAEGLWALYKRFAPQHAVTVVAPDRERSAVGHGITLYKPLRQTKIEVGDGLCGYAVSGTPVDCIKMGLMKILDKRPDLVISGINLGANVGININYSGTVAAAREAAIYKVPAIAVSVKGDDLMEYDEAARFTAHLAEQVFKKGLPSGTILNVNIPDIPMEEVVGTRISRQAIELYTEYLEKRVDPRNRTYYWHGHVPTTSLNSPDADAVALDRNYISITPIKCDMTDYSLLEELKGWGIGKKKSQS
ncbi:MAG: 5'/3'-nucleotidase SurE [Desulfobacterales bacterium]|uniref:5'-nucleotidase SurE n=1 Tax=Candidatus Desulfatibia vada TaxID=2841696 RepID=A0A8J6NY30_9BACT|nr:5'/3'-nucleotidase SurE [Candidatus Desulfatibia vada]MBL6972365.1 5'/3'-nucleotidase SurE [Desulfobacterales bacterium]